MCQIEGEYSHFWLDSAKCSCKSLLPHVQSPGWMGQELQAMKGWGVNSMAGGVEEEGMRDTSSYQQPEESDCWHHSAQFYSLGSCWPCAGCHLDKYESSQSMAASVLIEGEWASMTKYQEDIHHSERSRGLNSAGEKVSFPCGVTVNWRELCMTEKAWVLVQSLLAVSLY